MSTAACRGWCTIEDVIEQIVGEIDDEFDVEDDQNIRRDAERQFTVRGVTRIEEFNEYFGARLPEAEGFDTVAGLLMKQLGRLPRRGESSQHRRLRVPGAARRPPPHRYAARGGAARCAAAARRAARGRHRLALPCSRISRDRRRERGGARYALAGRRPRCCARCSRCSPARCCRRLCAAQPVAARGPRAGAAHVAVAGREPARGGAAGLLVQLRHLRRRHLLAVHQHPRLRRRAHLARPGPDARARGHHGAVSRRARLRGRRAGCRRRARLRWLLALPAAWLLIEWWRGWFLSGFSWLSLGYSQTDTWLAGFAPLAGVYGISALLLVCAGALTALVLRRRARAPHRRGCAARSLAGGCGARTGTPGRTRPVPPLTGGGGAGRDPAG